MKHYRKAISELVQSTIALTFTYNYIANIVNHAYLLVKGETMSGPGILAVPIKFTFCSEEILHFADIWSALCLLLSGCVIGAVILYYILTWICDTEWIKEPIQVEICWKEVKWYNPFSWVWVVVCVIKESFRWVLQLLCKYKKEAVWGLGIICVVIVIIAVL